MSLNLLFNNLLKKKKRKIKQINKTKQKIKYKTLCLSYQLLLINKEYLIRILIRNLIKKKYYCYIQTNIHIIFIHTVNKKATKKKKKNKK